MSSGGYHLFSGKQKKIQMQEKRERLRQQKMQDANGDTWTVEGVVRENSDSDDDYEHFPDGTKKLKPKKLTFAQRELPKGTNVICSTIGEITTLKEVSTLGEDKKGVRSQFTIARKEELAARKKLTYLPLNWRVKSQGPVIVQDARMTDAPPKRGGIPVNRWWVHPCLDMETAKEGSEPKPGSAVADWQVKCLGLPRRGKCGGGERDSIESLLMKHEQKQARLLQEAKPDHQPQGRKLKVGKVKKETSKFAKKEKDEDKLVVVSPEDLADDAEFQRWLQWCGTLAPASPTGASALNQFERNLQVWQQLWRTVERSDVVLIVCDARYPNIHCPESMLDFVCKQNKKKAVVVLNKSDWIPASELEAWKQYFHHLAASLSEPGEDPLSIPVISVKCLTGSAGSVEQQQGPQKGGGDIGKGGKAGKGGDDGRRAKKKGAKRKYDYRNQDETDSDDAKDPFKMAHDAVLTHASFKGQAKLQQEHKKEHMMGKEQASNEKEIAAQLNATLDLCKSIVHQHRKKDSAGSSTGTETPVNIGFIGQPNVGKSTLLNCLLGNKKVSVSSTAGHTKILQTIPLIDDDIVLIDCPGLCLPFLDLPVSLDTLLGTHQVAQARDPVTSIGYLGLHVRVEEIYKLKRPKDDQDLEWCAYELCEQYATKKGFRNRGAPDVHRSAQALVSEAYDGRIKEFYFQAPVEGDGSKKKGGEAIAYVTVPAVLPDFIEVDGFMMEGSPEDDDSDAEGNRNDDEHGDEE